MPQGHSSYLRRVYVTIQRNRQQCRGHPKVAIKVHMWVCRGRDMATTKIGHLKAAMKMHMQVHKGSLGMATVKSNHLKAAMKVRMQVHRGSLGMATVKSGHLKAAMKVHVHVCRGRGMATAKNWICNVPSPVPQCHRGHSLFC